MTPYQPKDMSGSLFKNDKGDNPNRPDYRGDICINGQVYSLSAWIKDGRPGTKMEGRKFMSLSAQPKQDSYAPAPAAAEYTPSPAPVPVRMTQDQRDAVAIAERAKRERAQAKPATNFDDMDDDIPF